MNKPARSPSKEGNLIDGIKSDFVSRALLEDALETIERAVNEMDGHGARLIEAQEYVTLQQAALLLKLALDLP